MDEETNTTNSKKKTCMTVEKKLESHLDEYGLDTDFWIKQLRKIDITKYSQLQKLMDEDSFKDVLESAKAERTLKSWEPKRLRKCFCLPDVECEMSDLKKAYYFKHNASSENKLERETLLDTIENKQEIPNFDELEESEVSKCISRNNQSDIKLVQSISGGMMLKGYFLTSDRRASAECRQTLLKCPKAVKLVAPKLIGETYEYECCSKEEADDLQHALKHGGHSYAASLGGGTHGLLAKVSAGHKKRVFK